MGKTPCYNAVLKPVAATTRLFDVDYDTNNSFSSGRALSRRKIALIPPASLFQIFFLSVLLVIVGDIFRLVTNVPNTVKRSFDQCTKSAGTK